MTGLALGEVDRAPSGTIAVVVFVFIVVPTRQAAEHPTEGASREEEAHRQQRDRAEPRRHRRADWVLRAVDVDHRREFEESGSQARRRCSAALARQEHGPAFGARPGRGSRSTGSSAPRIDRRLDAMAREPDATLAWDEVRARPRWEMTALRFRPEAVGDLTGAWKWYEARKARLASGCLRDTPRR